MATNFHKDLPNSQVHNPKDFPTALSRSVCVKNSSSLLKWIPGNYTTSTTMKCYTDVSGQTGGTHFLLYNSNDATKWQVWFDVDSGSTAPTPLSGFTLVEVDISENDTGATIATALKVALHALSGITAGVSTDTVTITGTTTATNPTDVNTNFLFTPTQSVVTNEYLTTDGSGNIGWEAQPAVDTNTQQGMFCGFGYASPRSTDVLDYMSGSTTYGKYPVLHNLNHSTSMPSVLTPVVAMQAAAFRAGDTITVSDLSVTAWCDEASASTAPVTVFFMTARPATGTGTWALTEFTSTGTLACENDEIVMFSKTSAFPGSGIIAKGDIIIPFTLSGSDDNCYYSWTMKYTF